ncbi:MAG TPA: hypothetical protein VKU36_01560 [Candidatus Babeliales bacterium]|nr:hypothetical protein [Candidatus Babeliales bacterium]
MKHYVSLFTFLSIFFMPSSNYGMKSLCKIERQIVRRKIRSIGKENILKIGQITTLVDPYGQDSFSQMVMKRINKKPSSPLGKYTQYRHAKDDFNVPYIELVSTFNKDNLLKILNKE